MTSKWWQLQRTFYICVFLSKTIMKKMTIRKIRRTSVCFPADWKRKTHATGWFILLQMMYGAVILQGNAAPGRQSVHKLRATVKVWIKLGLTRKWKFLIMQASWHSDSVKYTSTILIDNSNLDTDDADRNLRWSIFSVTSISPRVFHKITFTALT